MASRGGGSMLVAAQPQLAAAVEFLCTVLGLPEANDPDPQALQVKDHPELLEQVAQVSRHLGAYQRPPRDGHGRVKPEGRLHRPTVDLLAQKVLARVRVTLNDRGLPVVRKWPWRDGRPLGVALSHDVDLHRKWRVKTAISYAVRRGDFRGLRRTRDIRADPWWTYDTILGLERAAGTRSTFFLAAGGKHPEDPTYRIEDPPMQDLARRLRASGWEVGLHGSYRASEDPRLLADEKRRFESATGRPVDTYRQHYLRFHPASPRLLRAAGFRYDSSLGTEFTQGFLTGVSVPHYLDQLLELPVSLMDTSFQEASDVNRAYRSDDARREAIEEILSNVRAVQGLAVVDWHQNYFDEEDHPGFASLYRLILERTSDADRGGVRDLARWWETRSEARLRHIGEEWRIDGRDLGAGFTVAVSGGRLECDQPVTERNAGSEALFTFTTPGPWTFRVV